MCEIGKPLEILNVEPLNLPAPLRREQEVPEEQPVTVEVPVAETEIVVTHGVDISAATAEADLVVYGLPYERS
jgi:hypothetical protein